MKTAKKKCVLLFIDPVHSPSLPFIQCTYSLPKLLQPAAILRSNQRQLPREGASIVKRCQTTSLHILRFVAAQAVFLRTINQRPGPPRPLPSSCPTRETSFIASPCVLRAKLPFGRSLFIRECIPLEGWSQRGSEHRRRLSATPSPSGGVRFRLRLTQLRGRSMEIAPLRMCVGMCPVCRAETTGFQFLLLSLGVYCRGAFLCVCRGGGVVPLSGRCFFVHISVQSQGKQCRERVFLSLTLWAELSYCANTRVAALRRGCAFFGGIALFRVGVRFTSAFVFCIFLANTATFRFPRFICQEGHKTPNCLAPLPCLWKLGSSCAK